MLTKTIDLDVSKIYLEWLIDTQFTFNITKVDTLRKRLKNGSKYPFKWILRISTTIDELTLDNNKRKELISVLNDIPEVL